MLDVRSHAWRLDVGNKSIFAHYLADEPTPIWAVVGSVLDVTHDPGVTGKKHINGAIIMWRFDYAL